MPSPHLGAPSSETSSVPGGVQARLQLGQGWLQECKDFCGFYINNTLIPLVVQAGPLGVHCVDPAPLPLPPLSMRGGVGETFPCSVLGVLPSSSPTLVLLGVGMGGGAGSGLGLLQEPQQGLCDAQEVDHLSNAKQRSDD